MPRQIHILFNLLALLVITYIVVDTFYRVIGIELHQIGGRQVTVSPSKRSPLPVDTSSIMRAGPVLARAAEEK